MTPSDRDTDPTPVSGEEPTLPAKLPPPPSAPWVQPPAPRDKRETGPVLSAWRRLLVKILDALGRAVDDHASKIALALVGLVLAGLTWMTIWIAGTASAAKTTASDAKAAAETATAQGITGQAGAVTAATAAAAVVSTSKEKADSTVADLQRLTDRVNSLEAELARARSRKRRTPIKLSPKTEKPAPASTAAAVEQAKAAPPPAPAATGGTP